MRAVIVATRTEDGGLGRRELTALRPILDRPVLQHLIEQLVDYGVRDVGVVTSDRPEDLRAVLGDGRRWGTRVDYHLARRGSRPAAAIRRAARGAPEGVVLAMGDTLVTPSLPPSSVRQVVFCQPAGSALVAARPCWSGLAFLPPGLLDHLPEGLDPDQIGSWLIEDAAGQGLLQAARARLRTDTAAEWVDAQRAALEGVVPGLLFAGREIAPGVWLARNARVHETARLLAPVWLGENCRVEAGAVVGPRAAVGAGSIVDVGAHVESAVVLAGTYVGESVEVQGGVAGHGTLLHVGLEVRVEVADPIIIGAVAQRHVERGSRGTLGSRVLGFTLLALFSPFLLARMAAGLLHGRRLERRVLVRQPVGAGSGRRAERLELWSLGGGGQPSPSVRDLADRVLPGLWSVATGQLRLVGVTPRTEAGLEAVPEEWRDICAGSPAGLVTEAMLNLHPGAPTEAIAAVDAAYAVSRGAAHDLGLIRRYLAAAVGAGPDAVG